MLTSAKHHDIHAKESELLNKSFAITQQYYLILDMLSWDEIREMAECFRQMLQKQKILGISRENPGLSSTVRNNVLVECGYMKAYYCMQRIMGMTKTQFESLNTYARRDIRKDVLDQLGEFSLSDNIRTILELLKENKNAEKANLDARNGNYAKLQAYRKSAADFEAAWEKVKQTAYAKFVEEYNKQHGTFFG